MTEKNQNQRTQLASLIDSSFKLQKIIFYGVGIVSGLTGISILLLSVLVPPKTGEENIVLALQGASVVFIIFAIGFPLFIRGRLQKVKKLIFETPEKILEVKSFNVTKRGIPGFAVRILTNDKKMIGFNVIGPKTQIKIVELIENLR